MRTNISNHRGARLGVESLEGKTLLSTGSVAGGLGNRVPADAAALLSGSVAGFYGSTDIRGGGHVEYYTTSGTLSGIGSANLFDTLYIPLRTETLRRVGGFFIVNADGAMRTRVFASGSAGTYDYKVIGAHGSDAPYRLQTGTLTISQSPNFTKAFYVSGRATITFNPS